MRTGLTIAKLQQQIRQLKETRDFDVTLKQSLAYPTTGMGEVASEVLRLSRDGNEDVGKMDAADVGPWWRTSAWRSTT